MPRRKKRELTDIVWGCGHASHLMDAVQSIKEHPQIHLHFLTPEDESDAVLELCCHGCGKSLTVKYRADSKSIRPRKVREQFIAEHTSCPNRGYKNYCPDWRTSFEVLDIRPAQRRVFGRTQGTPDIPLLNPPPERQSRDAGRTEEGSGR